MVKKTIKFDIYIKTSEQTPTYSYTAKQKVMSNDKDSTQITFNLLDVAPEELSGSSASILLYMEDGSFFQKSDVTINRNSVIYTMKPEETRHSGNTKVQIVLNKGTVQTASLIYHFEIERGLEKFPIVEKEIQDWTTLTAEAKAFVDQIKDFTLEGFVENKMGEELANLETNYATRLTGLEQKDNQLTAQLAQKITKDRGEVSSGDLSQEVKEQMTGGSVAVVGKNAVLRENIVDGQVSHDKTDFAEKMLTSPNLYNKNNRIDGYEINGNDGTVFAYAARSVSLFIDVKPSTTYKSNLSSRIAEYDLNGNFIKVVSNPTRTITTGATGRLLKISTDLTLADTLMLVEGEIIPSEYQAYGYYTKIDNLYLDEEEIKDMFFDGNTLKSELTIDKKNLDFIYRESINLFDKSDLVSNHAIHATTGEVVPLDGNYTSGLILAEPDTHYSTKNIYRVAQYDINGAFLREDRSLTNGLTTEPSTAYMRLQLAGLDNVKTAMLIQGSIPPYYVPYEQYKFDSSIVLDEFPWKTWNVLGDSITSPPYAYWSYLAPKMNISMVNNYGVGGTAITPRDAPWDTNAMSVRYADMSDDADLITVLGGTNDNPGSYGMPEIGTMEDRDTSTFYGSCHVLFGGLVEKYPTKTIAVFTPLPKGNMHSPTYNLEERVEIIKEVCAYYSIPCLDLYHNSQIKGFNEANKSAYMPDGIHPNEEGHKLIARQMLHFLKGI